MPKFEWEDRYMVLKRKDVNGLSENAQNKFWQLIDEAIDLLPEDKGEPREFLVLEPDWPEYEVAKQSIEARMMAKED